MPNFFYNRAVRRYFLLIALVFVSGLVFYFSFTAPASAQFLLRERFTSDLHNWTSSEGVVVWQSAGTVDSYYQPDGDIGSAVWMGYDILESPSVAWDDISIGNGSNYTLHFDWYWTGEPFTITHGSVVGTGLNCYGSDWPPPFDYFVVNKWNSCYLEFSGVSGTHSATRIEATSGAIDAIQRFWLLPPAGSGEGVPGEIVDGTAVSLTVTATPVPTATPLPLFSHYLVAGNVDGSSTTYDGHSYGTCNGLTVSLSLPWPYQGWAYCRGVVVSPKPVDTLGAIWDGTIITSGDPQGRDGLALAPSYGAGVYASAHITKTGATESLRYCLWGEEAAGHEQELHDYYNCQNSLAWSASNSLEWDQVDASEWGIYDKIGDISATLNEFNWVAGGSPPPTPTPPPPTPSLPPTLGFGHNCTFTPTVGITGTITATVPITVSSSLLVDGGFEDYGTEWQLYNADEYSRLISGVETGDTYEGLRLYYALHNENDVTDMYLCSSVHVPLNTDVLEFSGAFRSSAAGDIGFGINQGSYQAVVVSVDGSSSWLYGSDRINAGGQSVMTVCVDWASAGGDGQDTTALDALSIYALDRPDGVSSDDFDNLELICPDPDSVLEENGTVGNIPPTATPDIFANVTPVVFGTPVAGGLPPIDIPIGVTPYPTRCLGWAEIGIEDATVPGIELCLELYEVDMSGIDDVVPLPFSFMSLSIFFLSVAVAFAVISLVKNR